MRYACLVHFDTDEVLNHVLDDAGKARLDTDSLGYNEELSSGGNLVHAEALQSPESAVLVRVRDGRTSTTDGPFIETKEQLAGFILIEARDMNDAIRIASGIPLAKYGTIEVRAIYDIPRHQ